ncbi:MAG TPA: MBL fold hydrolase [Verrucomicrobia bacterium]|nr:MAG: MBL fold hydrolase [Lentisphaerae bacterium GWF2_57_35]HBA85457.1 MBL fold hydrolase [Verrucomicrobiota bacterium]
MKLRKIADDVWLGGAVDWERRLFDALIPLPEGTSYNAYLVQGTEKTVLIDAVDLAKIDILMEQLESAPKLDYIVSQHSEQDHSGSIPALLEKYPEAKVLASPQGRTYLIDLLNLPPEKVTAIKDGETLSLGGKTLRFLTTPWVHWPDTMCTFLEEDRILFTCDFFGSHLAASETYATDERRVYTAAKLYYAQIMMPYAKQAAKNIEKVAPLQPAIVAPSHGPLFDQPAFIVDAWKEWTSAPPKNQAVIAYVSMHESTRKMAERLTTALVARGVRTEVFDLTVTDLGRLAMALLDSATLILGSPAVLNGPHPIAAQAALLANALKPKVRFASAFGSYGWGVKALEGIPALLPDLGAEFIPPVFCKGLPKEPDFQALEKLAETITERHKNATLGV